jgi:hypothetical protein
MPTKNIECQLAQGQIGRYLSGERFSPQAIKQLESHVADCEECSALVTRRRQALMNMVGEGATRAAVMAPKKEEADQSAAGAQERLISALSEARIEESTPSPRETPEHEKKIGFLAKKLSSKPLLYGAGLAAVLLAMSYFSRGALKTFGSTAAESSSFKDAPAINEKPSVAKPHLTPLGTNLPSNLASSSSASAVKTNPTQPIAEESGSAPANSSVSKPSFNEGPSSESAPIKATRRAFRKGHRHSALLKPHRLHATVRLRVHRTALKVRSIERRHLQPKRIRSVEYVRMSLPAKARHRLTSPTHSTIRVYDAQGRSL